MSYEIAALTVTQSHLLADAALIAVLAVVGGASVEIQARAWRARAPEERPSFNRGKLMPGNSRLDLYAWSMSKGPMVNILRGLCVLAFVAAIIVAIIALLM